ncbi:hypothetical protein AB1Y20_022230 [Prymnesium parvum]|uniref:ShKT domain-containing protein n=1 Tax=Prymnesium parvum TaxID=97485 RepID=A0AB34JI79_PRYPA
MHRALSVLLAMLQLPHRANAEPDCADDPAFTLQGLGCIRWVGMNCFAASELLGYSEVEEKALLAACPMTCHACPGDAPRQPQPRVGCTDPQWLKSCPAWRARDCTSAPDVPVPITSSTTALSPAYHLQSLRQKRRSETASGSVVRGPRAMGVR